jgi:hypothetical protein
MSRKNNIILILSILALNMLIAAPYGYIYYDLEFGSVKRMAKLEKEVLSYIEDSGRPLGDIKTKEVLCEDHFGRTCFVLVKYSSEPDLKHVYDKQNDGSILDKTSPLKR